MQPETTVGEDLLAESTALFELLEGIDAAVWTQPTAFKGWTPYDIVAHVDLFNRVAIEALNDRDIFGEILAGYAQSAKDGVDMFEHNRRWLGSPTGAELLANWLDHARKLAQLYGETQAGKRVPWAGRSMSARSLLSARQMETWAHAQAAFDMLGVERQETDRIRNVAVLSVNTFEFAFRNRGLDVPTERPFINLMAPSGALWTWNSPDATSLIRGSAVQFCQVAAQTRHFADTDLVLVGDAALAWAAIAQCFAGPPHDPPLPGQRQIAG